MAMAVSPVSVAVPVMPASRVTIVVPVARRAATMAVAVPGVVLVTASGFRALRGCGEGPLGSRLRARRVLTIAFSRGHTAHFSFSPQDDIERLAPEHSTGINQQFP